MSWLKGIWLKSNHEGVTHHSYLKVTLVHTRRNERDDQIPTLTDLLTIKS